VTNNTTRPYHSDRLEAELLALLLHSLDTPVNYSVIFQDYFESSLSQPAHFQPESAAPSIVMKAETETPQTPAPAQAQPATQYTTQWGTARAPPLILSMV
jgi:hypothetical protein